MHAFLLIGKGDQEIQAMLTKWKISSWDVVAISGTGIDDVRTFKRELGISPRGKAKAGIIHNIETLTPQAQNALLKTLEEPPPNTYIIGTTREPEMILPTIRSRMQRIMLNEENQKKDTGFAKNLLALITMSPGKQLQALDAYIKTRDDAKQFVDASIEALSQELQNNPTERLTGLLRNLLRARKQLAVNVNHKAVVDNVFLNNSIDN